MRKKSLSVTRSHNKAAENVPDSLNFVDGDRSSLEEPNVAFNENIVDLEVGNGEDKTARSSSSEDVVGSQCELEETEERSIKDSSFLVRQQGTKRRKKSVQKLGNRVNSPNSLAETTAGKKRGRPRKAMGRRSSNTVKENLNGLLKKDAVTFQSSSQEDSFLDVSKSSSDTEEGNPIISASEALPPSSSVSFLCSFF